MRGSCWIAVYAIRPCRQVYRQYGLAGMIDIRAVIGRPGVVVRAAPPRHRGANGMLVAPYSRVRMFVPPACCRRVRQEYSRAGIFLEESSRQIVAGNRHLRDLTVMHRRREASGLTRGNGQHFQVRPASCLQCVVRRYWYRRFLRRIVTYRSYFLSTVVGGSFISNSTLPTSIRLMSNISP